MFNKTIKRLRHKIKRMKVIIHNMKNNRKRNNSQYDIFQEEFWKYKYKITVLGWLFKKNMVRWYQDNK